MSNRVIDRLPVRRRGAGHHHCRAQRVQCVPTLLRTNRWAANLIARLDIFDLCAHYYMRTSGSGKTHTVFGPPGALQSSQRCGSNSIPDTRDSPLSLTHTASGMKPWNLPSRLGIVPRACAELLSSIACNGMATPNICARKVFNRTQKLSGACCHRRSCQHEDIRTIYW